MNSNEKGRELSRSRPMPFQQRTNTSWWSLRPQPADSRRLFRCFGAHLLRSPYHVKAFQTRSARVFARDGQTPSEENLGFPAPEFVWHCQTSSRRHLVIVHCRSPFVAAVHHQFQGNKKPCFQSGSRVGRKLLLVTTLPARPGSDWESAHNGTGLPIGLGRIHSRGWRDHDVSRLAQPASSSSSWLICSCSFSSNVREVYHASVVAVHLYF